MSLAYCITPFLTWLITGITKFIINSCKSGQFAFDLIGYGGFPSNHSAIVSSMVTLIAIQEGINNPALGAAMTLAFIVMLDANSLRRKIGEQAGTINKIARDHNIKIKPLREHLGHSVIEILAGIMVGVTTAWFVHVMLAI